MENSDNPAFPMVNPKYDGNWNKEPIINGLTKREYFAGLAMQGILSGNDYRPDIENHLKAIAAYSIIVADALLKQLKK